jgi:hypothetical protein
MKMVRSRIAGGDSVEVIEELWTILPGHAHVHDDAVELATPDDTQTICAVPA